MKFTIISPIKNYIQAFDLIVEALDQYPNDVNVEPWFDVVDIKLKVSNNLWVNIIAENLESLSSLGDEDIQSRMVSVTYERNSNALPSTKLEVTFGVQLFPKNMSQLSRVIEKLYTLDTVVFWS